MQRSPLKVAFICAGAFGIKTGCAINPPAGSSVTFIDTSDANLTDGFDESKCYRIPVPMSETRVSRGGAGQDRRRTAAITMPHIQPILERVGQADLYVLIFSAAGGSGSVIGPLLARELLRKDQTFTCVTVGEATTTKFLNNTIDTLKSLENISMSNQKPIVMSYFQNIPGVPQRTIDEEVQFVLQSLGALVCQHNIDLDLSDIHNWVNYNNILPLPPQLSALSISDDRRAAAAVSEPIATLSLFSNRDDYDVVGTPHYSKAGYPAEPLVFNADQLHFVINTIDIAGIQKELATRQTEQAQMHGAYRQRNALVNRRDDNVNGDDLVLS